MADFLKQIQVLIQKIAKRQKTIFLLLTIAAGLVILYPTLNFLPFLAQGDHGKDLYIFKKTAEGALPYRDYWWCYGPLMPYYYALCFKILGVSIKSVLISSTILRFASGMVFFLIACLVASPSLGFIATLWFWIHDGNFFYTFNHIGGMLMMLAIAYSLFLYLETGRKRYIHYCLLFIFLLSFIKINFGVTTLLGTVFLLWLTDFVHGTGPFLQKRFAYSLAFSGILIIIALIWLYLLAGLPLDYLRQCFPYFSSHPHFSQPLGESLKVFAISVSQDVLSDRIGFLLVALWFLCVIQTARVLQNNVTDEKEKQKFLLMISILIVFCLGNLHEFLLSANLTRIIWAFPFFTLLFFSVISLAVRRLPLAIRLLMWTVLLFAVSSATVSQYQQMQKKKNGQYYLAQPQARIFVGNSKKWVKTVNETVDYLSAHLQRGELFFALPYDAVYYFLTDKDNPLYPGQFLFFEYVGITTRQEKEILRQMEDRRVNYIVLSNRCSSAELGLGIFGKTHCLLLGRYIQKNFKTVAVFGEWQKEPGWAWNHGVKILKRIGR